MRKDTKKGGRASRNERRFVLVRGSAEEKGFEPLVAFTTAVFKTAAFDHSATPPRVRRRFATVLRLCQSHFAVYMLTNSRPSMNQGGCPDQQVDMPVVKPTGPDRSKEQIVEGPARRPALTKVRDGMGHPLTLHAGAEFEIQYTIIVAGQCHIRVWMYGHSIP